MTAARALARTTLLMRQHLRPEATEAELLNALMSTRVVVTSDGDNLSSLGGQEAFISTVLLIARSGGQVILDAPNVLLACVRPPLREPVLVDSLLEVGADLIPGREITVARDGMATDLAVVLGDSEYFGSASEIVRISGDAWSAGLGRTDRWSTSGSPFGALAAGGLAAGEAYKFAMRSLRHLAAPGPFDEFFQASGNGEVSLAPVGSPPPPLGLGKFDFVSGGAIAQAALYALARIRGIAGEARVIEPDENDLTNINRYELLRLSGIGENKAAYLARLDLGGVRVEPVPVRYDEDNRGVIDMLRPMVLVGVDNLESRWAVADEDSEWIGIGATEGYQAFCTIHAPDMPCVRCVHNGEAPPAGEIPTAAFVSHWAGLALAAAYVRIVLGYPVPLDAQVLQLNTLQLGSPYGIVEARGNVRDRCGCVDRQLRIPRKGGMTHPDT